jgi:nucleoside-diphosphate-sugar epimerase
MLVRELLASGHVVLAVDCLNFGGAGLAAFKGHPRFTFLDVDVRDLTLRHFSGVAAVVDLAAIASVSAAEQDARHTDAINHLARVRAAQLAQAAGVARHVLVSSAAVYGNTGQDIATEASPLAPQSEYARACVNAEQGVLALASAGFCPVVLRPGTAYGLSPRMRTDLMLNRMTMSAVQERKITLHGGGLQWRPHVHVRDLVRAIVAALRVVSSQVHAEIFNISHSNLRVLSIAEMVREVVGSDVSIISDGGRPDTASYQLDCSKARHQLGWRHYESICSGTYEVAAALRSDVAPLSAAAGARPVITAAGWTGASAAQMTLN